MRFRALATDYDGTLAEEGRVDNETLTALLRVRETGRRLVLVTGRELEDLMHVFPRVDIFDAVVAENGALLYKPRPPTEQPLASPPPPGFVRALRQRGVRPMICGRILVATWQPNEEAVRTVIREQGLALDVIFNRGVVLVVPSGTNKGTGLGAALRDLGVPSDATIGVGDAENDLSLLEAAGLGVAVANGVPALKYRAQIVTSGARGRGVIELCDALVENGLEDEEVFSRARVGSA